MLAALGLARRGLGTTSPNPSVGCILVRPDLNNRVVGRGWTLPGGRPHAETVAIEQAGDQAQGATAYVSLEPCCHHGETPPCSDALIAAGVSRVVVALEDPDPRVSGNGIKALRDAGIDVLTDVCRNEAADVNAGFILRTLQGRPFFTLKSATTLDSKTATKTGDSQWITGPDARAAGHALRAGHDAILTGMGTVSFDNPMLTCRLPGCEARSPVRIVLDTDLSISKASAIVRSAALETPVWIFTTSGADATELENGDGVRIFRTPEKDTDEVPLDFVARTLANEGMTRVLVEAGGNVAASFLEADLIDAIVWFRAASIIGGDGKAAVATLGVNALGDAKVFDYISARQVGPDVMETYRVRLDA